MLDLGEIIGLISAVKSRSMAPVIKALLSDIATLVVLTVVTGIMISALMIALLYGIYVLALHYGLTPEMAIGVTVILALLTTALIIYRIVFYAKRLQSLSSKLFESEPAIVSRVTNIGEAFMRGLLAKN